MQISTETGVGPLLPASQVPAAESAQRRHLMQAAKTVNESGTFGHNEIVFSVDRATHRSIMRVEDPETHEVILQLPPEYVLRLAQEIHSGSAQTKSLPADR
jgi:uncharacterized FlaG/YvyC family protein